MTKPKKSTRGKKQKSGTRPALSRRKQSPADPVALHLIQMEISFDPLGDPYFDALPTEVQKEILAVDIELENLADAVPFLQDWIKREIPLPRNWNHLTSYYMKNGRSEEANALTEDCYRRFPEYLFGRLGCALICLENDDVQGAEALLKPFSLPTLCGRELVHVSEFRMWSACIIKYLVAIGEIQAAGTYLDMLAEVDPDHPMTTYLKEYVVFKSIPIALQELLTMAKRTPRGRKLA